MPGAAGLLDAVRHLPGAGLLEPPHVSLGYPWLPAPQALQRLDRVRAAASGVPVFRARLTGPHRFVPDSRGRTVVHARPDDDGPFVELARVLGADLRDVHLSVARVLADGDLAAVEEALRPLLPLEVEVRALELTVQESRTWRRALLAPLGG